VNTPESTTLPGSQPSAPVPFLDDDKARACIHCGLCLGACPTYLETGNENDSPRGRIYLMRAVQDGRLPMAASPVRHIDLCLGCRACEAVCPSGVQYGHLLEHTRDHVERRFERSTFQKLLRRVFIEKVFPHPARLRLALAPARVARGLGVEKLLPKFARDAMSLIPRNLESIDLDQFSPAQGPARGRVGFLSGCVMSVMFGPTNAATVRLLNRAGLDVVVPPNQACCGALFAHSGNLEAARQSARQNIAQFESLNCQWLLTNAAGCGSTLKEYGQLLRQDSAWAERARQFAAKIRDLTEFLVANPPAPEAQDRSQPCSVKVTYHDACHLAHAQRITQAPRDLVKAVAGKNFVELPEADVCCGSAGTYNLTEPAMARRLQTRKVENILKTGAQILVTSNPGCILQIQAGLRQAGANIEVLHIADFLERMSPAQLESGS
jgi:glycolate dehydrogenase iron-sulfur subunit